MNHPLFRNKRIGLYYALLFLFTTAAHFFIMIYYYRFPAIDALLDSLVFYLLFGIFGVGIGFIVQYTQNAEKSAFQIITFHALSGIFIVSLWLHLSYHVARLVILTDWYHAILEKTVAGRMVEGSLTYTLFVLFYYLVIYYYDFRDKIQQEVKYEALLKEAELKALKTQINPHFLFNSLNSVSSLTITDPGKAQEMVIKLSSFLRYSLQHDKNKTVPLSTELDNIKLYLDIEKVRFGKKLAPVFQVEDDICRQAELPNMILQPIFENAIKYGVYETTRQINIVTRCFIRNNSLHVIVSNNYDADTINRKGEGIGLRNIQTRLQLIYGSTDYLKIRNENNTFTVELIVPQNTDSDGKDQDNNH